MSKSDQLSESVSENQFDDFWLEDVFPEIESIFRVEQKPISEIKDSCVVFLDANVLLLPYELNSSSFSQISETYKNLKSKNRLKVPERAAREFVKNRAQKIADMIKHLVDKSSQIDTSYINKIKFLDDNEDFKEIKLYASKLDPIKNKITDHVNSLRNELAQGVGRDPVSVAYSDLFEGCICGLELDQESRVRLVAEMRWRYRHNIPPGYKDKSKSDGGIGDYLIWRSIIEHGAKQNKDAIFVTKDLKGDWWSQSSGPFQPRVELVEEYYRSSEGKTIHFIDLSSLLSIYDAGDDLISTVREVEEKITKREEKLVWGKIAADNEHFLDRRKKYKSLIQNANLGIKDLDFHYDFNGLAESKISTEALQYIIDDLKQKLVRIYDMIYSLEARRSAADPETLENGTSMEIRANELKKLHEKIVFDITRLEAELARRSD